MMKNITDWGDFVLGFFLAISLSILIIQTFIFAAYNQPENFGETYKDIFCTNLK